MKNERNDWSRYCFVYEDAAEVNDASWYGWTTKNDNREQARGARALRVFGYGTLAWALHNNKSAEAWRFAVETLGFVGEL